MRTDGPTAKQTRAFKKQDSSNLEWSNSQGQKVAWWSPGPGGVGRWEDWGTGGGGRLFNGSGASVLQGEKLPEFGCTTM